MRLAVIIGCLALVMVSWMTLLDEACFAARSLVYFSSPSCSDCLRVRDLLRDVESRYPDITVMEISIANENGQMLLEEYCRYCEVNEDEYGLVPTVIVGNKALVGFRTVSTFIEQAIEEVQADTPLPESFTGIAGAGAIDERFASFSAGALLAAGCVDGINPCAISTLLFFVSYMASTGQRGRMILGVGARFTLGVFISYTMMGWGLFRLLAVVEALTTAARFLYPAMAVLVTGLAFVSVFDYRRVRGAGTSRPLLALPIGLVRLIRPTIRRLTSYRLLLPMSFAVGFAVSLMEFLCTGQVYFPLSCSSLGSAQCDQEPWRIYSSTTSASLLPWCSCLSVRAKRAARSWWNATSLQSAEAFNS